jgi:hypothetical protein
MLLMISWSTPSAHQRFWVHCYIDLGLSITLIISHKLTNLKSPKIEGFI